MTSVAPLLAHQGGWDEVLLVAGPIVAIVGLLMLAKRRVDSAAEQAAGHDDEPDTSSAGPPVRPERRA